MKKLYFILVLAFVSLVSLAQEPLKLNVTMKNGEVTSFNVADIDSITFTGGEQDEPPVTQKKAYKVTVPSDFSKSFVLNVKDQSGKKVGEVCKEYLRLTDFVDASSVVVYAADDAGKADLTKNALDLTGNASITWDKANNAITAYTALTTAAPAEVYITSEGEVSVTAPDGAEVEEATIEPNVINDKRGSETFTYAIVKIGCQYWMTECLKATKYVDGTAITKYTSNQLDAWGSTTDGGYHLFADDADSQTIYGAMYNGYTLTATAGLAPAGWDIPETEDYTKLKSYVGSSSAKKLKSDGAYDWTDGGTSYTPTNITNFNAEGAGYFSKAMNGDAGYGTDLYLWTKTQTYDALSKGNVFGAMRLYYKNNNLITTGTHGFAFGHYVRCIMK